MRTRWLWCMLALACLLGAWAAELTPAVSLADLDAAQCQAFDGGRMVNKAPMEILGWMLGLREKPNGDRPAWSTGPLIGRARHFRLAFIKPVELGTVVTTYSGGRSVDNLFQQPTGTRVSYLKADAPYPGDVTKDEQWVMLPPGDVKYLPVGVKTRALRFTDYKTINKDEQPESRFGVAMLLKERCYNPLLLGTDKEQAFDGNTPNAWMGFWNYPQPPALAGFVVTAHKSPTAHVEVLKADVTDHPLITKANQWKRLPDCVGDGGPKLVRFDTALTTRALRVSPSAGGRDFNYTMGNVIPLVNLGTAVEAPLSALPPSPVQVEYTMPMDGFVAINIADKKTGKTVRRLVAEVARLSGKTSEEWDLKDDHGQYVPPGDYEWRAIARPPLKLTYEITVNNAGQPAWWSPPPGKGGGGWLADHTPPHAVCAVGDYMFLGSACAESGHAMIATDLDGNKFWGEHNAFGGFLGVRRYAGDGRYAYMINGSGILRIDTQNNLERKTINLDITYTREVPGPGSGWGEHISGAAARDGKLYLAYSAPPVSWIQSTFGPSDVDLMKCLPVVRRVRGSKSDAYREGEFDEVQQFHSALLDGGAASCNRVSWGEAPKSGALAGSLTVVYKKPIPIGSVLVQNSGVKVYALKPGAKLPDTDEELQPDVDLGQGGGVEDIDADPFSEDLWIPLTTVGKGGMPSIAATQKGLTTTALRFRTDRIQYALVMSHRFKDVAADAERVFTDGQATERGGWTVTRNPKTRPISVYDPAMAALVWKTPVNLRGISLVGMTEAKTAIDYWVGPENGDPKAALGDDDNWQQVTIVEAEMHGPYPQSPAVRNVDFGANVTTRAVRIRAIAPKGDTGYMGYRGMAVSGPHQAGFDAIVAYSHLGQDPELPQEMNQRISEFQLPADPDKEKAKLLRHLPITNPGDLAFAPDGTLYAQSSGRLVTVPLNGGAEKEVLARKEVEKPGGMAFDADGLLYLVDKGSKVVKVFDLKQGKLLRTIGKPGGPHLGAWDPNWFTNPEGVTVDRNGKVWVAEADFQPKRISRWSKDGTFEKSFLGPTTYGGGGWMDAKDRSIVNYNGMKFVIDWATRTWKLDSLLFRPGLPGSTWGAMPDRALYYKEHRYLVGDPDRDSVAVICTEKNGIAVPMVAAGNLARWGEVNANPELLKAYGKLNRGDYGFLWQDENADGKVQATEVKVSNQYKLSGTYWPSKIGENLALNFNGMRLAALGVRPSGVPIYDLEKTEVVPNLGIAWTAADGRTFVVDDKLYAPDGKTVLWEYPDNYMGVHGSHNIGYDRPAGTLVGEHHVVGHFEVNGEELFVTNGNHGDWFAFTRDGLLAACIFGGPGTYGKRWWTMPEWEPGKTDLAELNVGEEHFYGSICKANDGKVYAVAGHNHNSVVRVDGLEAMKRFNGTLTVTKDGLEKTLAWEQQRVAQERLRQAPKVARIPFVENPMAVDGALEDWPETLFLSIHEHLDVVKKKWVTDTEAALAYDADNLYIAARVADDSPMLNSTEDLKFLYKYGDALDATLGMDPQAAPNRRLPAVGDLRLLISRVKGKPVAMVYRYNVPDLPDEKRVWIKSPVTETAIDIIKEVDGAEITVLPPLVVEEKDRKNEWIIEAAIPWSELGVEAPAVGSKLRGDVGVLLGDQNGMRTVARYYWAGKTQTVVSDLAFEARIAPALWGEFNYIEPDKDMHFGPAEVDPMVGL